MAGTALSFEKAIARLEEINTLLSDGDISLENGMKLFDEGLRLSAYCKDKLEEAKNRLEKVEAAVKTEKVDS